MINILNPGLKGLVSQQQDDIQQCPRWLNIKYSENLLFLSFKHFFLNHRHHTLPTEFQFESVFNLEFQPKFGIQLGMPIPMGINLGECRFWQMNHVWGLITCITHSNIFGALLHKEKLWKIWCEIALRRVLCKRDLALKNVRLQLSFWPHIHHGYIKNHI